MRTLIYFEMPSAECAKTYSKMISQFMRELTIKIGGRIETFGYWNENQRPAMAFAIHGERATECSRTIVEYLAWYRGYILCYAYDRNVVLISKKGSQIEEKFDCPAVGEWLIYERVAKSEARRLYVCLNSSSR